MTGGEWPYRADLQITRVSNVQQLSATEVRFAELLAAGEKYLAAGKHAMALPVLREARSVPGYERAANAMELWHRAGRRSDRRGLSNGWCVRTLSVGWGFHSAVTFTPDSRCLLTSGHGETLCLRDVESGKTVRTFSGHVKKVLCHAISSDGRHALSGGSDDRLRLWDLATGQCQRVIECKQGGVRRVVLSSDGWWAHTAGADATIRLWSLETGQCVRQLSGHSRGIGQISRSEGINGLALSLDEQVLVSTGEDRDLRVWDVPSGRCIHVHKPFIRSGTSMEHSWNDVCMVTAIPGTDRALLAAFDCGIKVVDYRKDEILKTLEDREDGKGRCDDSLAVAATADGRWGASGGMDHAVRIWDLASGSCLLRLPGHNDVIHCLAISLDGRWLASARKTTRCESGNWIGTTKRVAPPRTMLQPIHGSKLSSRSTGPARERFRPAAVRLIESCCSLCPGKEIPSGKLTMT